jgi:SAM-dependent methyltransferase
MSEPHKVLNTIREHLNGPKLLIIGRKVGEKNFDELGESLRVEVKPTKYPPREGAKSWRKGLLSEFNEGDFDSIILHRFLYKPEKDYMEEPNEILREVKRILPEGGKLFVNSFLRDESTEKFDSSETFFTKEEMEELIKKHNFKINAKDGYLIVCENKK